MILTKCQNVPSRKRDLDKCGTYIDNINLAIQIQAKGQVCSFKLHSPAKPNNAQTEKAARHHIIPGS